MCTIATIASTNRIGLTVQDFNSSVVYHLNGEQNSTSTGTDSTKSRLKNYSYVIFLLYFLVYICFVLCCVARKLNSFCFTFIFSMEAKLRNCKIVSFRGIHTLEFILVVEQLLFLLLLVLLLLLLFLLLLLPFSWYVQFYELHLFFVSFCVCVCVFVCVCMFAWLTQFWVP